MVAMTSTPALSPDPAGKPAPNAFTPRKVIIAGVGTGGTEIPSTVKGKELAEFGYVRPGLAFLAFDVMPAPPVVFVQDREGNERSVTLEQNREYLAIGKDLDPPHLSHTLRGMANRESALGRLLDCQPSGRFIKSLDKGTEGERAYGYLAYLWSQEEITGMIDVTLRQLNDVRLPDGKGGWVADAPVDVFITGSEAGGVGSAIALPLCGDVKRAMHRLGMPVHRSFFTYVALGPEAFPEKELRLANACEVLGDLAVAQQKGLAP